ncbi:hypothetical protein CABS01_01367 [Colletotrichum abscissum]|uniref:uncharacterized protein n=1 Tax=Colletotrichum abscissum TaxID=1671311 RepID=UPI0027D55BE4|nr:uncharacterized protein CABS01_01367 [Colletotrichum abscissum]KAK1495560.1 hypothetical protein CABS01_01367 [Colletotrichum abscissum]
MIPLDHTHTLHPHRIDAHIYSLFLPGSDLWCYGGVSLPSRISVPTPIVRRTPPTIPQKVGVARRVFHCPTKTGHGEYTCTQAYTASIIPTFVLSNILRPA